MSEVLGGSTRPSTAPVQYDAQQAPYQRTRIDKERWRNIQQQNKVISGKLRDVKREPPANWHAPLTYDSLAAGAQLRTQREGKANSALPCKEHYVDVPPWPPKAVESAHITRAREQRRVSEENSKLFRKLSDVYASRRPRSSANPGGVHREADYRPPELNSQWALRTSLYLPADAPANCPLSAGYEPPTYAIHAPHGSDATLAALARHVPGAGTNGGSTALAAGTGPGAEAGPPGSTAGDAQPPAAARYNSLDVSEWIGGSSSGAGKAARVDSSRRSASAGRASSGTNTRGAAAALASGPSRPRPATSRVPKTLGLVSCAGCGARGFYKADGVHLEPCPRCRQVWYCSEVCAQVDWPAHEHVCKWHQNGHWGTYGRKPVDQHWVASGAMAAGLRMLHARGRAAEAAAAAGQPPTLATRRSSPVMDTVFDEVTVVKQKVEAARARERRAEARQRAVEEAAYWGLDGPRPCMYMGGKPI